MEMTTILHSSPTNLPFHTPFSHSKFRLSFSKPIHHRISLPSKCLTISRPPSGNSLYTDCSLSLIKPIPKKAMDMSTDLRGTSIFLGMKISIKSSLGKLLADLLRYYYFDSDALVSEAAAISLKESDEKGFRESETEVLKQLLSLGRLVGALLRRGISIWIDVPLDMVAKGIIENKSQLLSSEIAISGSYSNVLSQLTALYEDMRRGYATVDATVSIQKIAYQLGYEDVDAVSTEDITTQVFKEIERLKRVKKMMEATARPF